MLLSTGNWLLLHILQTTLQQKYRADFERTKGKMIGLKGLQDDISIAHSVHASKLQSDVGPLPEKKQLTYENTQYSANKTNPNWLRPSPGEVQAGLDQGAVQVPPLHGHDGGGPRQEGPVTGQRPGLPAHPAPVHLAARRHEGAGSQEGVRPAERGENFCHNWKNLVRS